MNIRPAQSADVPALAELSAQLGYAIDAAVLGARFAALPAEAEAVFVADAEGRIDGWIQLGIGLAIESPPHVEIRALVVREGCRGTGIGRKLIAQGRAWAASRGIDRLRVRCNSQRIESHAFYRRLGFTEIKQQQVFDLLETP